eukprot:6213329-Pleurochrysis_carterae.AAC.2
MLNGSAACASWTSAVSSRALCIVGTDRLQGSQRYFVVAHASLSIYSQGWNHNQSVRNSGREEEKKETRNSGREEEKKETRKGEEMVRGSSTRNGRATTGGERRRQHLHVRRARRCAASSLCTESALPFCGCGSFTLACASSEMIPSRRAAVA